jgi:transcriptional antiterminator RfaH
MPSGKSWYLVYAKARQESVAIANLERQGYTAYLPLMRQARRRLGRRVSIIAPMFPRYLFIHLDSETDNWGPIRSTLGVVSIVRFGQRPAKVPDALVQLLRTHEDPQGIQIITPDELKPGTRVRVTDGSFTGYEGIFEAKSSRQRVVVLLDIMGRITRISLEAEVIEPAGRD